jgi:hypothetical protein
MASDRAVGETIESTPQLPLKYPREATRGECRQYENP